MEPNNLLLIVFLLLGISFIFSLSLSVIAIVAIVFGKGNIALKATEALSDIANSIVNRFHPGE